MLWLYIFGYPRSVDFSTAAQAKRVLDDPADAAIEASDRAVRLRLARRDEAAFNIESLAKAVEHVLAAGNRITFDILFFCW